MPPSRQRAFAAGAMVISSSTAFLLSRNHQTERRTSKTKAEGNDNISAATYNNTPIANNSPLEKLAIRARSNIVDLQSLSKYSTDYAKVRVEVASRFMDLLSRCAFVLIDYKAHEKMVQYDMVHILNGSFNVDSTNATESAGESSGKERLPINKDDVDQKSPITSSAFNAVHDRAAKSMYEACSSHGGLLVKLGQYVSTNMQGFVPTQYIEALEPLQDSCAPIPSNTVRDIIKEEMWKLKYGPDVKLHNTNGDDMKLATVIFDEVFSQVDEEPLGSASLAQVHGATLNDGKGTRVAVKVQRPNLDLTTEADLAALKLLSIAIDRLFPGAGFDWMIPEFHQTIAAELDFKQEAKNAQRCSAMLKDCMLSPKTNFVDMLRTFRKKSTAMISSTALSTSSTDTAGESKINITGPPTVIVPKPILELSTPKVMVMSFEEGFKITDLKMLKEHNISPSKVAAATCALFAELIHIHGFVHADPHPGNILVRPRSWNQKNKNTRTKKMNGEFDLVLLDHGMYRRLDERFRYSYCNLWAGLVSGNTNQALRGVRGMGLPDHYLDFLGLMLVYRLPSPTTFNLDSLTGRRQKLGTIMGKQSRKELKQYFESRYGKEAFSAGALNEFLKSQPRDLLFCLRCMNLVRGVNRELSGTTLDRFVAFGTAASRGSRIVVSEEELSNLVSSPDDDDDVDDVVRKNGVRVEEQMGMSSRNRDALLAAKRSLDRPVASEVIRWRNKDGKLQQEQQKNFGGSRDVVLRSPLLDFLEAMNISLRVWGKSLLLDLFLLLGGYKEDKSHRRYG